MNRDLEEQKIRQWFREARRRDDSTAPPFEGTLAAAQLNNQRAARPLLAWRIAVATALMAIAVAALVVFKQPKAQPSTQTAFEPMIMPLPYHPHPPAVLDPPTVDRPPAGFSAEMPASRRTRASARSSLRSPRAAQPRLDSAQPSLLSFKWQSPTDFLLRTPGAELLKTVPRVNDSIIQFDVIHPDEKN